MPKGVELIPQPIAEFDPEANKIIIADGNVIEYDYLILATGLNLDYSAIEGMDENRIGTNGLGSIYHSPEKAYATWKLLDNSVYPSYMKNYVCSLRSVVLALITTTFCLILI